MPGNTYPRYKTVSFANSREESMDPVNDRCPIDLRCHHSYIFDAHMATTLKVPFRGVSARTPFLSLIVDGMHVLDLGIGKYFLDLWLGKGPKYIPDKPKANQWVLTEEHIDEVNTMLRETDLPHSFSRHPRDLDSVGKWKADEFRQWIHYLSIPAITGRLPPEYVEHWSLFVEAYKILSKLTIHRSEIDIAENLLRLFAQLIPELYYPHHVTIKCHSLLHLGDCVRNFGPIHQFSAIKFEHLNGELTRNNHGKYHITDAITRKFLRSSILPTILSQLPDSDNQQISLDHPFYKFITELGYNPESKSLFTHKGWSEIQNLSGYEYKSSEELCSTAIE
jgi:hypothetical protein